MIVSRNGVAPRIDPEATLAPGATVVGDVTVGAGCYLDHGVVVSSAGPPIQLDEGAVVFANSVLRSTGGHCRPEHPLTVGAATTVGPQCSLVGCTVEEDCYMATAVIVFQGARVGRGTRLGG